VIATRTIKITFEILNPMFNKAIANRLINFNPCTELKIKVPRTKKTVLKAKQILKEIEHE